MKNREHHGWLGWLITAISLPILHFASLGPITWLDAHGRIPRWAEESMVIDAYFGPAILLHEFAPPLSGALEKYLNLWR
jgi:hypothetical protein